MIRNAVKNKAKWNVWINTESNDVKTFKTDTCSVSLQWRMTQFGPLRVFSLSEKERKHPQVGLVCGKIMKWFDLTRQKLNSWTTEVILQRVEVLNVLWLSSGTLMGLSLCTLWVRSHYLWFQAVHTNRCGACCLKCNLLIHLKTWKWQWIYGICCILYLDDLSFECVNLCGFELRSW